MNQFISGVVAGGLVTGTIVFMVMLQSLSQVANRSLDLEEEVDGLRILSMFWMRKYFSLLAPSKAGEDVGMPATVDMPGAVAPSVATPVAEDPGQRAPTQAAARTSEDNLLYLPARNVWVYYNPLQRRSKC